LSFEFFAGSARASGATALAPARRSPPAQPLGLFDAVAYLVAIACLVAGMILVAGNHRWFLEQRVIPEALARFRGPLRDGPAIRDGARVIATTFCQAFRSGPAAFVDGEPDPADGGAVAPGGVADAD
jgi:hypothetical protein